MATSGNVLKRNCRLQRLRAVCGSQRHVLRTAFIFILMALMIRVSLPQSETIWSAYETPADLIRLWLGIGVMHLARVAAFPRTERRPGYRTWLYLGLAAVPFAVICLFAIW